MSERRMVPRKDMLFHPWARITKGTDAGRVVDINHVGLSILGKEEYQIGDSFSLFIEDDYHEELKDKSLELLVEVSRCGKAKNSLFETGFKIKEIKSKSGDVLLNKIIRLLGSP
jgi:hypothetical protein